MRLEAMSRRLALVLDPMRITVFLAGRSDGRRIDKGAGLDLDCLSWSVISWNKDRSSPCATSALRKRTKAVRSGVGSDAENPQNRRNEVRSSSASASFTSDRSYQTEIGIALNSASGGHAGSPLAAQEITAR